MKNKFYIAALAMLFRITSVYSQVTAEINRPSVNAEQFGLALKAETALSKGQLSLNIPLMTLKGKGYDLPISLTFYNGDVTACTDASPIGLGWALMAGGVIATTVRGADDSMGGNKDHHYDSNYIENMLNNMMIYSSRIDDLLGDPMPDEQTYSLPGHSGTVELSFEDNTIKRTLFPDESYKIEPTTHGFCITDDGGNKFYFEDAEDRTSWGSTYYERTEATSWFLTRIITAKGGEFTFHYADEEYIDLSSIRSDADHAIYHTKRITSIVSDFGTVSFFADSRPDRGNYGHPSVTPGKESKRINKIELRDENGEFVKGYELDNSDSFKLFAYQYEYPYDFWYDCRLKLSSITQYDATGNRLPPYTFTYSSRLSKSRFEYISSPTTPEGDYVPYESWTSDIGGQAYVDLNEAGNPLCSIGNQPNAVPSGFTSKSEGYDVSTVNDYFCLESICYPTGAVEEFSYEPHRFHKVNNTHRSDSFSDKIQGKRLAARTRYGTDLEQRTEYIYQLHDTNNDANGPSSGVLTNPSIHGATYYTPAPGPWGGRMLRASRMTSGKPFNSFMGPPVCYTEVEEVEKDDNNNILSRTIHYFEPQIVSPPVNYFLSVETSSRPLLIEIENAIYGKKSGYSYSMEGFNNADYIYMAYPVGEFYNVAFLVDKPQKEVFIGKDGRVRSIKQYSYDTCDYNMGKKYGYKIFSPDNSSYYLISKSEYITRRFRIDGITTTNYYYDGNECDSICENYKIGYSNGRTKNTYYSRSNENCQESKLSLCYYPDDIQDIMNNSSSPIITATKGLIEKNIIADPIKTVLERNGKIIGGECKDYQMFSGMPLLKSLYKLKNTANNSIGAPTVNGDNIDYHADSYKEGEIITYDENQNPAHVRLNDTQDRIYVWGYGGRFPIAVVDNMNHTAFQAATDLRSAIMQLETYKKIETGDACTSLRNLNATIRSLLPGDAHITTYTYDPYFGMTSETDDSNLGTIFTYDSFGRLTAKYDVNYKKLEEYNYHYKLQQ